MRSSLPGDPVIPISSLAAALAPSPSAVDHILDQHQPDATGHCRGCRLPTTAAPVWPCRLWGIADEARRMRGAPTRR